MEDRDGSASALKRDHAGDQDVAAEKPDAVIVDIRPTHGDEGIVAAGWIRDAFPSVGVLVQSQYVEPSWALRLVSEHPEGVGYLLKKRVIDAAMIVDALRRVIDGETVVDPTIVARLLGRRRRHDPLAALPQANAKCSALSPRA